MSKWFRYITVFLCLGLSGAIHAQEADDDELIDPILIRLRGVVISRDDGQPVPYAHIINLRTHGGTTSSAEGYFSLEMLNVDSITVSALGYAKTRVSIPYNQHKDSIFVITLRPVRVNLQEVEITGKRKSVDLDLGFGEEMSHIDPRFRSEVFYGKKPKWYRAFTNPASFVEYRSKREKEKREVLRAQAEQKDWEELSKIYNKKFVMELTGLNEEQADEFMIYLNAKQILSGKSNEYDVRAAIIYEFRNYAKEKNDATVNKEKASEDEDNQTENR